MLPDGTTLLVDAGAATPVGRAPIAPPLPDASRRPGEWIARYVLRMALASRDPILDYALVTHFHGDHLGFLSPESPRSALGDYQLAGITDVAELVPIRKVLDRGWSTYDFPAFTRDPSVDNYRRFLGARATRDGLTLERFQAGRADQIRLVRDADRCPEFEIRNLHVNGDVWTGSGDSTARIIPPLETLPKEDWPTENHCSAAFLLRYGTFSYFTGVICRACRPSATPTGRIKKRRSHGHR